MTDATATERQARFKDRQRAAGLRQVTLWVTDEQAAAIRRYLDGTAPLPVTLPVTDAITSYATSNVTSDTPDKATLARQAQALHRKRYSYAEIAAKWNREGVPTARGGQWYAGTVRNLVVWLDRNS